MRARRLRRRQGQVCSLRSPRPSFNRTLNLGVRFADGYSVAGELAEALRDSEARKGAIVAAALDCIIAVDDVGCITEFNPAAERTFGYRRADVIGRLALPFLIPAAVLEANGE